MSQLFPARLSLLAIAACFSGAVAAAAPPPVEHYFRNCDTEGAAISPDGKHVLMAASTPGVRSNLIVVELATMKPTVLARYASAEMRSIGWVGNKRVVFVLGNVSKRASFTGAGMYAVDIDGQKLVPLTSTMNRPSTFASNCGSQQLPDALRLTHSFAEKTSTLANLFDAYNMTQLVYLDTYSDAIKEVPAPVAINGWLLDADAGLRVVVNGKGDQQAMHFRSDDGKWRQVATFSSAYASRIVPVLYADRTLYVQAHNGADKAAVYRFDLEKGALDPAPLVVSPDYDLNGYFITDGVRATGYRFTTDAVETTWFDARLKTIQDEVDALFPATNNVISPPESASPYVLVASSSPVHPMVYRIYDSASRKVTPLGLSLPDIVPSQGAGMEMMHYKASDGLRIPAYVTLPTLPVQKNLPLIVLAKSTTLKRGALWNWDPEVQFLASRGYAVIQPETRGTTGFGDAFYKAGAQSDGAAADSDLADAARWAIAQGIADPKRICIVGKRVGGYRALTELGKNGSVFRCGISIDATIARGAPVPSAIAQPVFLGYSEQDKDGDPDQARAMFKSFSKGNAGAELHVFDSRKEGTTLEKERIALWTRIAQFLEKYNGKL